jgi:hypothetical protein
VLRPKTEFAASPAAISAANRNEHDNVRPVYHALCRTLGGLASACVEGILASCAFYDSVIDADLQHDEQLLPQHAQDLKN